MLGLENSPLTYQNTSQKTQDSRQSTIISRVAIDTVRGIPKVVYKMDAPTSIGLSRHISSDMCILFVDLRSR